MTQNACYVPSPPSLHGSFSSSTWPGCGASRSRAIRPSVALAPALPRTRRPTPMRMGLFGLGFPEIAVIAGVAALVFGPGKIAELGKDLGGIAGSVKKATVEFQEAMSESLEEADRDIARKKSENPSSEEAAKTKAVSEVAKSEESTSS